MARTKVMGDILDSFRRSIAESIGSDHEQLDEVVSIVDEILDQIGSRQDGYDGFCRDVLSKSGSGTVAGGSINQYPGVPCDECHPIVVGIVNGRDREEIGFSSILRQLRAHLILCRETQVAIVVTDVWNKDDIEESRGDLLAHEGKWRLKLVVLKVDDDKLTHMPNPL